MLEPTNNEGLVGILLGMMILVFTGVGLSLLMDRTFDSADNINQIRLEINQQTVLIGQLETELKSKNLRLSESEFRNSTNKQQLELLKSRTLSIMNRRDHAAELVNNLTEKISVLENSHQKNLAHVRKLTFAKSVGEYLGTLTTLDGRTYQDARIREVNENGMNINHPHGSAFISALDLPQVFWERYQWHGLEITRKTLRPTSATSVNGTNTEFPALNPRLIKAREDFLSAGEQLIRISADHRAITSLADHSSSRSVPNSLDTWLARKERLNSELSIAKAAYEKARAELIIMSPDDPLLQSKLAR